MLQLTSQKTKSKNIEIHIFGLGYVGLPLAVRLAISNWNVIGIDVNSQRIERLKQNNLMESELILKKEFIESLNQGRLTLTTELPKITDNKIGIICVPTPVPDNNQSSSIFVEDVTKKFLESSKKGDVIIIESSVEVGTTDKIKKIIELKGYKIGENFGLAFCPERIDPQNKKWNLENIPRIIYCSDDNTFEICKSIYQNVNNSNLVRVSSSITAEIVKSFENAFRLVNISLVNELAILCDKLGINVSEVIQAASTKPFGFMPFYTGAGAGGHCIPKDPTFLINSSKKFGHQFSIIEDALKVNSFIPKYIAKSIENLLVQKDLAKSVIISGMSYKPDIEDMRDSPSFKIVKELTKLGFAIAVHDPHLKKDLIPKYLIENKMKEFNFKILEDLDEKILQDYSCLCIVQHHTKPKLRIEEIYQKSLIPVLFDCQNQIQKDPKSHTILKSFGGQNYSF